MPESTRASADGQVSEKTTYEDWLKSKTPEEQRKVLGDEKVELWRRGVITFADMLDQRGRPLRLDVLRTFDPDSASYIQRVVDTKSQAGVKFSLEQLRDKYKHAFEDLGLPQQSNISNWQRYHHKIVDHLNDENTKEWGTYGLETGSKVFYNASTRLAVVIKADGNFSTTFILDEGSKQLENYLKNGLLR